MNPTAHVIFRLEDVHTPSTGSLWIRLGGIAVSYKAVGLSGKHLTIFHLNHNRVIAVKTRRLYPNDFARE